MFQALHILVKDTKKLWPEILASLAIAAAFVWVYPYYWIDVLPPESNSILDLGRVPE